jgi:hypothetical protein
MNISKKSIRRELLYLVACAAFGMIVLPGILFAFGNFLVERRIVVPEIWPASLHDMYRGLYSSPLEDFKYGDFQFIFLMAFYCLSPYVVFQVFRWAFRGTRFLWEQQRRI